MGKPNYVSLVQAARQTTIARGVDVNADECSRFAVLKLAASLIAQVEPGVGLLAKPTGNNCEGFAVDVLCWPDGVIVDCLGAGPDGPCSAIWLENPVRVDPSRWRPPVPSADVPRPIPDLPVIVVPERPAPLPVPVPLPPPERAPEPPQTAPAGLPESLPVPTGLGAIVSAIGAWLGQNGAMILWSWYQRRQATPKPSNPVSGAIPRPAPPSRARLPK